MLSVEPIPDEDAMHRHPSRRSGLLQKTATGEEKSNA